MNAVDKLVEVLEDAAKKLREIKGAIDGMGDEHKRQLKEQEGKLLGVLDQYGVCPNCGDQGFYVQPDGNGEPEQIQCQWCHERADSLFNLKARAEDLATRNAQYQATEEQATQEAHEAGAQEAIALVARATGCGKVGKCSGCGAMVYWFATRAGKDTPVNMDGTTHWATCPQRERFKR